MMMTMMLVCNVIRMSLEMDLMSPFLLRQTAVVSNVHVTVTSLNRVQLDRSAVSKVCDSSNETVHELEMCTGMGFP